ncbi:hypothetical protein GCM10027601_40880 [Nocardioides ungokensis]
MAGRYAPGRDRFIARNWVPQGAGRAGEYVIRPMCRPRLTTTLEDMNPLTVNPAIALDHARRANAEAVRTAERHRREHALREADPRRTDPRPPWWRRWTPRPPDPRRTGTTGPASLPA